MNVAVLYSGGKDSNLAAYLATKHGCRISCLICIVSENKHSFMFHTPSIAKVRVQAEAMGIPLIEVRTKGEKEKELHDLTSAIRLAIEQYDIDGIVTGAVASVYQASRIQSICNDLSLGCFNPLWQKPQDSILNDLLRYGFSVVLVGVFAYPLDQSWLGKTIDASFLANVIPLFEKYGISVSGEGGEYESFVLDSPLFKKRLSIQSYEDSGEGNSWMREIEVSLVSK